MKTFLDPRVLAEFAQDVGVQTARRFADQYCEALEDRLDRLAAAAAAGSVPATYETAASFATASAMVGATTLAQAAWSVTRDVARHGTLPSSETLHGLERLARFTAIALRCHRAGGDDPR
jgi:hypothetical protein